MDYSSLVSIDNLFQAWEEFKKGKRKKRDVQVFERNLEDNLFTLHRKLTAQTYRHGSYQDFYVNDPKRRHIHKAQVVDRVVHHLLYKHLYALFDETFIFDSYSCRLDKGTHKAVKRLEKFSRIASKNYTQDCWILKLDIKRFFASVDHQVLKRLIAKKVKDKDILWLIDQVIDSFPLGVEPLKGIPLGNLTSQIFANVYLNELDRFVKHRLKIKYHLRYADDFVILRSSKGQLLSYIDMLESFLKGSLELKLHPQKIILRKLTWGIDFCGYIVLPRYRLVRAKTRRRIFKKVLRTSPSQQSLESYLGHLSHANSYTLKADLKNLFYLTQGIRPAPTMNQLKSLTLRFNLGSSPHSRN
ncbi:hypothetical protein A2696_00980 [Candidatus Curtissbacteria bacterium RIFCSPHIGHO2_01_FULL_41_13]|uniref:Reverse transcriptase domain-containing protein n=1 Tax=Candidatus Curtissbacteria bacterium RIFCSPHIGHO2_01_FULL_41_13 TaxID=1797745 RepID=A0A1F5G146_9BACT|nr:MAG: hypothetical protein A2696_00980 [Candidatus Curtissbacteria bacterium RIFCSPHIGHO2_01_FULL_41_13]